MSKTNLIPTYIHIQTYQPYPETVCHITLILIIVNDMLILVMQVFTISFMVATISSTLVKY